MNYFISPNCIMIECIITPSTGQTVANTPFVEQQQLLNRPILAIQSFCSTDFAFSPLSAGVPVIPVALFNTAFLSITRAGNKASKNEAGKYYKNIPLCMLRTAKNDYTGLNPSPSHVNELFRVKPMFFQWPDSEISFPTPQAQATAYSVPFMIHYLLENENPLPYLPGQIK